MSHFFFVDIDYRRYTHDRTPDECPICHFSIEPEEKEWTLTASPEGPKRILEIVFKCTRRECGHYFIARYKRSDVDIPTNATGLGLSPGLREFVLHECLPSSPLPPHIPEEVLKVSPLFLDIYSQAITAESSGLEQLAGMGLIKALECLIKDYCIQRNPQSAEQIIPMPLGGCIEQFVTSPEMKVYARRTVWLRNDETRYMLRWTGEDIKSLKELILLTVNWIHSSTLARRYDSEMP